MVVSGQMMAERNGHIKRLYKHVKAAKVSAKSRR